MGNDPTSTSFVQLFLNIIRTENAVDDYNPNKLLKSIEYCIRDEDNKVLFINENGLCNFINYFLNGKIISKDRFGNVCESVYDLQNENVRLIHGNLTNSVSQLMAKFIFSKDENILSILKNEL
ncbi:hypothetical protein RF11_11617 [Thelohanellus kitauei]|uniref:Uncharacterized protein n=1 Tax=Thelohanellus kitauei TaxID=669202 RepID=A0A0C2MRU8_THEKT|nr:hypothetical protein RF11_11617 [Thelohanellus kitauei]